MSHALRWQRWLKWIKYRYAPLAAKPVETLLPGRTDRLRALPALPVGRLKRLESRHVMSVTAAFAGGVLDIQVGLGGNTAVGLFATGNDFFVDQNNNQTQDGNEVSGLIANIGRLQATSPDLVGSFLWRGDFSRAPLNQPNLSGAVVSIEGFQQTNLQANFRADGNLHVTGFDQVSLGNQVVVRGAAELRSDIGSIVSDGSAQWTFQSTAELSARGEIALAQSAAEQFDFQNVTTLVSTHDDVRLGSDTNVTLDQVKLTADDATLLMRGDLTLETLLLSGNLRVRTDGALNDSLGSDLRIQGNVDWAAGSIVLGDDAQDRLVVLGTSELDARTNPQLSGLVSIGSAGLTDFDVLSVRGHDLLIEDDNRLIVSEILATGDCQLTAGGVLQDAIGASIQVDGNARWLANSLTLADNSTDVLRVAGSVQLEARLTDIVIGTAGHVELGQISASARNIELIEDSSMLLNSLVATGDLRLTGSGAVSDTTGAILRAATSAQISGTSILLADDAQDSLDLRGLVDFNATGGDVSVGIGGSAIISTLSASGREIRIREQDDVILAVVQATQSLDVSTSGTLTDITGASISVNGPATLRGSSIALATNPNDQWNVDGLLTLTATSGDVALGNAGLVEVQSLSASGQQLLLSFDSAIELQTLSASGNLRLDSSASVSMLTAGSIQVGGSAEIAGASLRLATGPGDLFTVQGATTLSAPGGDITIGDQGLVQLGAVTAIGRNLVLQEDSDLQLERIDLTGNATLESSATIVDTVAARLQINGEVSLRATDIRLADDIQDVMNISGRASLVAIPGNIIIGPAGVVNFGSIDARGSRIEITEFSDTRVESLIASQDATLISLGNLSDALGSTLRVGGQATFDAQSIQLADDAQDTLQVDGSVRFFARMGDLTVGPQGDVRLGDVQASGRNLLISEDADMRLTSIDASGNLTLESTGTISDAAGARLVAAGNARLTGTAIALADNANDQLIFSSNVSLTATVADIEIGPAGLVNLGTISAVGRNVSLSEDADMVLDRVRATGNLVLETPGTLSDVTGASIVVDGTARARALSIVLADRAGDVLNVTGAVEMIALRGDVQLGSAGLVTVGAITASGINLEISEDADTVIQSLRATSGLYLTSSGSVTDLPGSEIRVAGTADITATEIVLADQVGDQLIVGGSLTLLATLGDITIGPLGFVDVGDILATGRNLTFHEDADMVLRSLDARGNVILSSGGTLTDVPGAFIRILGSGSFTATEITLADSLGDTLNVVGAASFNATGDVRIGSDGQVTLGDVSASARDLVLTEDASTSLDQIFLQRNLILTSSAGITDIAGARIDVRGESTIVAQSLLLADNISDRLNLSGAVHLQIVGDLTIASAGLVNLGTIDATAANIAIFEDAATVLNNVLATNVLRLDSTQSIVNLVAADAARTSGVQAATAVITAGTFAHLGQVNFQILSGEARANGVLPVSPLLVLNQRADAVGSAALDLLNEPSPSGSPVPTTWIDGTQLADVQREFSYEQSFARQLAWAVSNINDLQIGTVRGVGDGLHLYIETLGSHDLSVTGSVQVINTSTDDGAMALIAGKQLTIAPGAALETQSVSGLPQDSQRVLVPLFQANAFDGGQGPVGFESTRSVILERALDSDTRNDAAMAGAQNVFQQVSSQFGASGEAGFLAIIRYADGQTQLFDTYREVFGSFDGNSGAKGPAGTFQGSIPAHAINDGAAALLARSTPFSDVFLNGAQELPTAVIYRRSTDFYLFENGGSTDAAIRTVNLDSDNDRVLDVLTNAVPPSFSLPTIIATAPQLLPAPVILVTDNPVTTADIEQDVETKVEFDATRQVVIYRVGFDDQNGNGQPEDRELPDREQIIQQFRTNRSAAADKAASPTSPVDAASDSSTPAAALAPGQLDTRWRDVQKDLNPTPETLEAWIDQYRRDPRVGSGAYSIVEEASRTGIEVLRIFSVRDFDEPRQPSAAPATDEENRPADLPAPDNAALPQPLHQPLPRADATDVTRSLPSESPIDADLDTETSERPVHAFFAASGLVWLSKRSAEALCDQQLRTLTQLPVSFDRASRQRRLQASDASIPFSSSEEARER